MPVIFIEIIFLAPLAYGGNVYLGNMRAHAPANLIGRTCLIVARSCSRTLVLNRCAGVGRNAGSLIEAAFCLAVCCQVTAVRLNIDQAQLV